jgi:hypothetical protein
MQHSTYMGGRYTPQVAQFLDKMQTSDRFNHSVVGDAKRNVTAFAWGGHNDVLVSEIFCGDFLLYSLTA